MCNALCQLAGEGVGASIDDDAGSARCADEGVVAVLDGTLAADRFEFGANVLDCDTTAGDFDRTYAATDGEPLRVKGCVMPTRASEPFPTFAVRP